MKEVLGFAIFVAFALGYINHLIVAILAKAWLFMIAGALIPPVAVVHGIASFFGADWLG